MFPDDPIPHPEEYREFFRLFNAHEFFDAHEVLEDLWAVEVEPVRTYYKGLIMLAVAILHWQRGNRSGALRLYRDGRAYLEPYPGRYEDFDLDTFRKTMDALFAPLCDAPETARPPAKRAIPRIALGEGGVRVKSR